MMGRLARAALLGTALVLGAIGAAAADGPLQKVTFLANYSLHGRHSPFFVGTEKGFYKEAGLEVDVAPTSGSGFVVTAVDGGKADFGMADPSVMVQAIAKGAKVKGFFVFMDISTTGLASLTPYPTLESIRGKKIAASLTDGTRTAIPVLFAMKGLDPASLDWLASDPSVYYSLLFSGKADLFTASLDGDIPALTKILEPQGKKVYFSGLPEWGYDVFGYLLLARADRIAEHPEQVKAFAAATSKAVLYAMAHPEETAAIMVKYNPTLKEDVVLSQWRQTMKAIDTAYMHEHGYGIAGEPRLARTIELVEKMANTSTGLKPNDIFATGFVPKQ